MTEIDEPNMNQDEAALFELDQSAGDDNSKLGNLATGYLFGARPFGWEAPKLVGPTMDTSLPQLDY